MTKNLLIPVSLFLLICLGASQTVCLNCWDAWNQQAANGRPNGAAQPTTNSSWKVPTVPPMFGQWVKSASVNGLNFRYYQYLFKLNAAGVGSSRCQLACGIQSFPTYDAFNNLVCYRNPAYWGNLMSIRNAAYKRYCVPHLLVWNGPNCNVFAPGLFSNAKSGCNQFNFNGNYLNKGYECCYDNANRVVSSVLEEVDLFQTTNYNNVAKPAYLYNSYT